MRTDCYFCHIKTVEKLINKFQPETNVAEEFIFYFHELLSRNMDLINPKLATEVHRLARKKLGISELYAQEKSSANQVLIESYDFWKHLVYSNDNPFATAAKLAVVGNIIDYGAHSLNGDLKDQIRSLLQKPLKIDHSAKLYEAVKRAKSVLYLGDNAGEIVFDKLFIETMEHPNITFVVRGAPVINDVTMGEAKSVGMDTICKVISNGYDAPSTLLDLCSREFREIFKNADLVISKGQGNFEGLMNDDHPSIFFMLIAKCIPMANMLRVGKEDMVIMHMNNYN